jgi:hypothetical protein
LTDEKNLDNFTTDFKDKIEGSLNDVVKCTLNFIKIEKKVYNLIKENYSIEQMALNAKAMSSRITNLANAMRVNQTITHINCNHSSN